MNASLAGMLGVGASFLLLLWLCAQAVERGWIATRITRHPLVYTLALGVYTSAWAIYGSLELAAASGYGYLTYYLGMAGAFLLAPVLLVPIQRMVHTHQLASLADLFAFRYRSRWVGTLITLVSLLAVLPLLALQMQTMGNAIYLITGAASPATLALVFCVLLALFDMTFVDRRRIDGQHDSLLAVMALSSLIKLLAMLTLGAFALFAIFDGPADVQTWLEGPGQAFQDSVVQTDPAHWRSLLMLFFAGLLMPHIFHLVFTETRSRHSLLQASWALPLFLLLMALPVPLILWAGQRLGVSDSLDTAYLAFGLSDSAALQALAFLAGLAATSATTLLIALALSGMLVNHVFLVAHPPAAHHDLYRWLRWLRRSLVAAVVLGGWLFYRIVGVHHDLTSLGITAFVGMVQCLPGLLALLYWPGANRRGMVTGLVVGLLVWLAGLWVPLLIGQPPLVLIPPGLEVLNGEPAWYVVTLVSLASNALALIVVSLATPTSAGERAAAEACSVDAVVRPKRLPLEVASAEAFKFPLARALGESVAAREVDRALDDLGLSPQDDRPYALRRLRDRLQANLSGLMGPSVAQDIVDRYLPYRQNGSSGATEDIHFVESRLEAYRSRLTGLARELDGLRRYHRRTLTRLPVGLCAFGEDGELLMWNDALARLSGIEGGGVVGAGRESLPAPWSELLGRIIAEPNNQLYKQPVTLDDATHYLSLHKAQLEGSDSEPGGMVILVEDHSEMKWLEDELVHAARLASIGQLAAGVAHEIGNPITGISSLAQNLRYETDDPEVLETTEQIQQLTDRVSRIVSSLVGFAHGGRHLADREFTPVAIAEVVDEAIHLIHLARSGDDMDFDNRCPVAEYVEGDSQRLLQVMINLLSNARDASAPGDGVIIEATLEDSGLRISVTDEGAGIDASVRDRLFEPFTTTKPPGEGTGLGLPLVYSIVAEHHGTLDVESPPPGAKRGTRISLWLPHHQKEDETPR